MTLRKNLCEISDIDLKVIRISIHEEKLKLIHNMRKRNPHTRFVVFWVKLRQTRIYPNHYWPVSHPPQSREMANKVKNPKYVPKTYEQILYPGQRVQIDIKHNSAACLVSNLIGSKEYRYRWIFSFPLR